MTVVVVLAATTLALAQSETSPAPTASASPTPVPALPSRSFSIQEEVSPNYDGETGSSSLVNLRAQVPFVAGGTYVVRFKLPVVTSAPATAITGAGDLALYGLAVSGAAENQWLQGITIRVPSAQNDSLGTGKYSLGPAIGYQTQHAAWTLGFFQQSFFSVIGPRWRRPVGQSKIEPVLQFALPRGWSAGFSTMTVTYDWVRNRWTEVPIGMRIGKKFGGALHAFAANVEAEQNLVAAKGTPAWTMRALLQTTF